MTTSIEDRIAAAQAEGFDPAKVRFDVWYTQGGGLATWDPNEELYVFIQKAPGFEHLKTVPREWGVLPVNEAAHREMDGPPDPEVAYVDDLTPDELDAEILRLQALLGL